MDSFVRQSPAGSWMSAVGLLVAVGLGSIWTAMAVVDGSTWGTLVRFVASIVVGAYYLVLFRLARAPKLDDS